MSYIASFLSNHLFSPQLFQLDSLRGHIRITHKPLLSTALYIFTAYIDKY